MKFTEGRLRMVSTRIIQIFVFSMVFWSCAENKIELYSPINKVTINNNMPTLSWQLTDCDYYEIWIDHRKMAEVDGNLNAYTPFALSFGEHEWQVKAITGNQVEKSAIGSFTVDDDPLEKLPENSMLLRHDWEMISSLLVDETGKELTYHTVNTDDWYPTSLPATALSVLVRNGVYPNPNVGFNNLKIPDASDEFNIENDLLKYSHIEGKNPWKQKFWFRTTFVLSPEQKEKQVWLNLGEINYRAEVWLNGELVADSSQLVGMERHFKLNISNFANKKNVLAIAIYPPDHIGKPSPPPVQPLAHPGRNLGEDAMITMDYTKWDVLGWDWQPGVRDRDMGITEDIYLTFTNKIEINNLYVTSDLPLPDTTSADITISADITNNSLEDYEGTLSGKIVINDENIEISEPFMVKAGETKSILWNNTRFSELKLEHPKLWWPFGYGNQNLYNLTLHAVTTEEKEATATTYFGIREVETYKGENERVYKINGKELYMKGGNWVIDMHLNWTASRYDHEIRLTKASGLNLLRVWGPTGAPPKAFYDAADKYGVMIWQDFLNDYWGTFLNQKEYTPTFEYFTASTIDIIKKYRNHPSLVIWCGGNEGPNPKEKLILDELLPKYDGRDSKHYLKISNADGLHGGGPYQTIAPKEYFKHEKLQGFSSELGPSGIPVQESLEKFMTERAQNWKPGQFPINGEWTYHDATDRTGSDERKFTYFDNLVRNFYGVPDSTSLDGFNIYVKKCQLISYEAYRSCIEAINCQLWDNSSGYALWKSNSSWPSVVWQVYDWYMQAHAGFYATQQANELVHIQLNRATMAVDVLNASHKAVDEVKLIGTLYNKNLEVLWSKEQEGNLSDNSVYHAGWAVPENNEINYLLLSIKNKEGKELSRNFYWLNSSNNFNELNQLTKANLTCNTVKISENQIKVTVSNNGNGLAFMIALKLIGAKSGNELLPSYWDNNYFSLLPGESIETTVNIDKADLTELPAIEVNAYNMEQPMVLTLQ